MWILGIACVKYTIDMVSMEYHPAKHQNDELSNYSLIYYFTYCPLCLLAHRAATSFPQSPRSSANCLTWPQVILADFISASKVLLHVFFGLPWRHFPSGVQWRAVLVVTHSYSGPLIFSSTCCLKIDNITRVEMAHQLLWRSYNKVYTVYWELYVTYVQRWEINWRIVFNDFFIPSYLLFCTA